MDESQAAADRFLPEYDVRSIARRRAPCTAAEAWAAWHAVTGRDIPLGAFLAWLRYLPDRLRGRSPIPLQWDRPVSAIMEGIGWTVLERQPPAAWVLGAIAVPWRPDAPPVHVDGVAGFQGFDQPGYVKILFTFTAIEAGPGTRLQSEARVQATDRVTRRKFRRYWFFIGTGSWLLRYWWLKAAVRKARRTARSS